MDSFVIEIGSETGNRVVEIVDNSPVILESFRGPKGASGDPGIGAVPIVGVDVDPTMEETADLVSPITAYASYWNLMAVDLTTGDVQGVQVYAMWDSADNTWRTVYGRTGYGFATFDVLVTKGTTYIELRITNNHTNTIRVRGTRLDIE